MKIEFINHASLIFNYDKIKLITDPWIEGSVFHDGWSHLSETRFKYSDFKKVTHIWFSHEHPDHFFPPNIKSIPPDIRKNITVLFQETKDKKIIEFCKKLKFKKTIELIPNKEYVLSNNFKIINSPFGDDSWLYIKTDKYSFLNTNDCVIKNIEQAECIKKVVGNVDVLLAQFSYAGKHGNIDQPERRVQAVEYQKEQLKVQFKIFSPEIFIPIASFIWFSHEENFYMNDNIYSIDKVYSFSLFNKVKPIILYPNDSYKLGDEHDNQKSIDKYLKDLKKIRIDNVKKTVSTPIEEIKRSFKKLQTNLLREDFLYFIYISFFPIRFYLTDKQKTLRLSFLSGLKEVNYNSHKINIKLTSEALDYCLKFYWGFNTLEVNARYQTNKVKDVTLLNKYETLTTSLNHSVRFSYKVINTIKRFFKK